MSETKRVEARAVVEAYRATGAGVTQDRWAEGGHTPDECIEACGLGVLCLDAGATVAELRAHGSYRTVAARLGLSVVYTAGFSLGFDGRVEVGDPLYSIQWGIDRSVVDVNAASALELAELRAGIEDGAAAFAAVNELDERGELYPPAHYVDAATATGMYDHD